jgi:CheY-like chemotaxis protein
VEVLQLMRSESNIPEIIMFTGHGTIETAVECIKLGAYDYLTKPVKLDELEMLIDRANEKNRLRMENINLKLEVSKFETHRIIGNSLGIQKVLDTVKRWGPTCCYSRRERHRQGADCPRCSRCQSSRQETFCHVKLRQAQCLHCRKRTVRAYAGGFYRRYKRESRLI